MKQTVTVKSLGQFGDGLVQSGDTTLHISKVLPGEEIEIENGRLRRVIEASHERNQPVCKHFEVCGGCKFQHWQQSSYAAWKRQHVVATLERAGLKTNVGTLIDAHGTGRRRVVFHVREIGGSWQAGFMEAKSHDLVAIETCPVLDDTLQNAPVIAASFGPSLGPCDVAITKADHGLDVAVKAERSAVARRMPVLQQLFGDHKLVRLSVNGDIVLAVTPPTVTLGKATVALPINPFLQATEAGEFALVNLVRIALKKSRNIVDLFCGIGPFTFALAEDARVHAADVDQFSISALQSAVKNTQGLRPVTSEVRDLFRNPLVHQELNEFDGVVLDPPRAGAEAQVRAIARSKVRRVAYVSCDVQTFARDAAILVGAGMTLRQVTPVDQFKWTAHTELVGEFTR